MNHPLSKTLVTALASLPDNNADARLNPHLSKGEVAETIAIVIESLEAVPVAPPFAQPRSVFDGTYPGFMTGLSHLAQAAQKWQRGGDARETLQHLDMVRDTLDALRDLITDKAAEES